MVPPTPREKLILRALTGAGEGMKVGILALLREDFNVAYYTNKEIWDWRFANFPLPDGRWNQNVLSIDLAPYQSKKATSDTSDTDIRAARKAAHKHTTVIVNSPYVFSVDFANFLFLVQPPPQSLLKTEWGTILLAEKYRRRIFVKGIFVEERRVWDPPALYYGIDFSRVGFNRDRQSLMTRGEVARLVPRMWDKVICEEAEGETKICAAYLELMEGKMEVLETGMAGEVLSQQAAERLLEQLVSLSPKDVFFYFDQEATASEVRPPPQRNPLLTPF
jgi:hypothetical protein